jgi:hypothetical protein
MLRKHALIAVAALGLAMGSGAALAAPVGLQSLAHTAPALQERGATLEPVHYRSRRHVHARRHFVHPRRHAYVYPRVYGHRYVVPRHRYVHPGFVRRHHYGYPYYYRTRPRVSLGLSFGW